MATVLLGGLLEGTLLGDMSLFVAIVAEAVTASALKKGMLYWSPTAWSQRHPIFGRRVRWSVGDVRISDLLQRLYLFHPSLYSIHLHVDCEQSPRQQLFLALYIAKLLLDLFYLDQTVVMITPYLSWDMMYCY